MAAEIVSLDQLQNIFTYSRCLSMEGYKHCTDVRLCQNCLERDECSIEYPWNVWSAYLSAYTATNNAPAQNRV